MKMMVMMKTMGRKEVVVAVATVAVAMLAAVLLRRWQRNYERRWKRTQDFLRNLAAQCATPVSKLWQVTDVLVAEMEAGVASPGRSTKVQMLVSHVETLPTGDEEGIYYGLNLSGTNFQMWRALLGGKKERIVKQESETVPIPSSIIKSFSSSSSSSSSSSVEELFDYIAMELAKFVLTENQSFSSSSGGSSVVAADRQGHKKLGFTYSFRSDLPDEVSPSSHLRWKTFSIHDAVGKDMVDKMNKALQKHNVPIKISSMVHDSVGDLAGDRYYNGDVIAAVTLGSGINAAYIEHENAETKIQEEESKSKEMIINVEWGNFSSSHLPITEFDASLDAESSNPGEQIFEKFISAKYLGEIVRRALLKMAKETALFGESIPPKLKIPYVLSSPDMAAMHQDISEDRHVVGEKLKEVFEIANSTPIVREVVADVCDIIVERGARVAGAAVVGILKKLGRIETKELSVLTVDGGVYQHYRLFRNYLHSCVWEMLGREFSDNVHIHSSNGGSGIGAVFLAASSN